MRGQERPYSLETMIQSVFVDATHIIEVLRSRRKAFEYTYLSGRTPEA